MKKQMKYELWQGGNRHGKQSSRLELALSAAYRVSKKLDAEVFVWAVTATGGGSECVGSVCVHGGERGNR